MFSQQQRSACQSVLAVAVASAVLAGCGDDETTSDNPPDDEQTPAATATATPTSPPVASDDDGDDAAEDAADAQDDRREAALLAYFTGIGGKDRWSITEIDVDGGRVSVDTELFPKASSKPGFMGACTSLIDYEPWIERIEVEGQDDLTHAAWSKGDVACQTQGL